jgi:hypothetical protein
LLPAERSRSGSAALRTTLDLSVARFQIDSSSIDARYPVAITSKLTEKGALDHVMDLNYEAMLPEPGSLARFISDEPEELAPVLVAVSERAIARTKLLSNAARRQRQKSCFLKLQFVLDADPTGREAFDVYRYLVANMQPLEIKIDAKLVAGLLKVLDPLRPTKRASGSIEDEGEVPGMHAAPAGGTPRHSALVQAITQRIATPAQDTVMVERASIGRTALIITVNLGSNQELKEIFEANEIPKWYLGTIDRLSRLEDFSLDVSPANYQAITMSKFIFRFAGGLRRDVLSQLHELVFNSVKRWANLARLTKKRPPLKMREPLMVNADGVLQTYGPGTKPSLVESVKEKEAVRLIERAYLQRKQRFQDAALNQARGIAPQRPHTPVARPAGCWPCRTAHKPA